MKNKVTLVAVFVVVLGLVIILGQRYFAKPSNENKIIESAPAAAEQNHSHDHDHKSEAHKESDHSSQHADKAPPSNDGLTEEVMNPVFERKAFFEADIAHSDEAETAIQWHSSCNNVNKEETSAKNIQEFLEKANVDGSEIFPASFVQDWNMYLSKDGKYLQLSANWQTDNPPTYALTLMGSDDMDFKNNVNPFPIKSLTNDIVAWDVAKDSLHKTIEELKQQGYKAGKRTTIVSNSTLNSEKEDETARAEYFGSKVRIVQNKNVFCVPKDGYLCYCR